MISWLRSPQFGRMLHAAVQPERRLVAGEIERRWGELLRADEQLPADYERFQRDCSA